MSNEFISNFITECIEKNIFDKDSICEEAIRQSKEIDIELAKLDKLRRRQIQLRSVLKSFDHESVRRIRGSRIVTERPQDKLNDSMDLFIDMKIKICDFLEKTGPVTSRSIMDAVGDLQRDEVTYGAIKSLSENGIIDRDNNGRVIKGVNWDKRPSRVES